MTNAPWYVQVAGSIFFVCAGIGMIALSVGMVLLIISEWREKK